MNNRLFIIMVGIPGSGKSTKANELKKFIYNSYSEYDDLGRANICEIISSDAIRKEILGDENDQSKNDAVFKEVHNRIRHALIKRHHVIVDATNIKIKSRKSILNCFKVLSEKARQSYIVSSFIMTTPIEECKIRNKQRDRVVPDFVIDKQMESFEIPFYEEGIDAIFFDERVQLNSESKTDEEVKKWVIEKMGGFNQNTHHHKYTLDEHCLRVYEALKMRTADKVLIRSGLVHDYGKMFTQKLKKDGSGESCYYSHHNVGAYKLMSLLNDVGFNNLSDNLKLLFYVNYHMQPFFLNSEKAKEKWKHIWTNENYDALMLFNECDKIGSGREIME